MLTSRPYIISIAGFDPTAGAGILADIKCFEQHQVYGFGICTALTIQTDNDFLKNDWVSSSHIINQLEPLLVKFNVVACKIGLIKDTSVLQEIVLFLKSMKPAIIIVLDPILKASAGYVFHDWANGMKVLSPILTQIDLITPNYEEMLSLGSSEEVENTAKLWAEYCAVLLKGGHNHKATGTDYLYWQNGVTELRPGVMKIHPKHGSGCVLSAAITANLALGDSLYKACYKAKKYIEKFLNSNPTLLGYHNL